MRSVINRPLLISITHRCHEKQSVAMDSKRRDRMDYFSFFSGSDTIVF